MSNKKIVAIVGPSGAGKSTLMWHVVDKFLHASVVRSSTTREPRATDHPGEYEYLNVDNFNKLIKDNAFAWNIGVHDKQYGTRKSLLNDAASGDYISMLILTPEAAEILYKLFPEETVFIFVLPPKAGVLRERLLARGNLTEWMVKKRIEDCVEWTKESHMSSIPYVYIRNDGLPETAFEKIDRYVESLK